MVCLHLQEVNAVVFFRQHWTDRRLAYGSLLGISKMRLKEDILDKVWLPDTYFVNEVSDGHKRPGDYLFELSKEGDIIYSYRYPAVFLFNVYTTY